MKENIKLRSDKQLVRVSHGSEHRQETKSTAQTIPSQCDEAYSQTLIFLGSILFLYYIIG
jgi:hypothetical protein